MDESKVIYIDLYLPIFTNAGLTIKEIKHLKKIDIYTDVNSEEIVFTLRRLIFEKYGDGLYIRAEEFDSFCYINVHIYFGDDINTLVDYLYSISKPMVEKSNEKDNYINDVDEEISFLSINWADPEEIKEFESIIDSSGFESNRYLVGQSAFERGAGDYHQYFIFIIGAIASGALNEIGKYSLDKILNLSKKKERTSLIEFNPKTVIDYVSSISGVNTNDLRITKIAPIDEKKIQINVSSRYKDFILQYSKKNKSIINYEKIDKTQIMI